MAALVPRDSDIERLAEETQHPRVRYFRHRLFTVYRRLFTLVFAGNLAGFIYLCTQDYAPTISNAAILSTPISANIFIAVLFRNNDFVNFLYTSILWVPLSLPLTVRRRLAKIYEFGGVHSGTAVAATFWAFLFTVQITRSYLADPLMTLPVVVITYVILAMLLAMVAMSHPRLRVLYHNSFEHVHRFCGWTAVILYWVLNGLLTARLTALDSSSLAKALFTSPTIYFLIAITIFLIIPWLRLRRIKVRVLQSSSHAKRLYFPSLKAWPTQTVRISTSPLLEWHSFAIIPHGEPYVCEIPAEAAGSTPARNSRSGNFRPTTKRASPFSVIVSLAGDWTRTLIENPEPEHTLWFYGLPTTGVTKAALLFRSAVIVTTGSGIGPALSLLLLLDARAKARENTKHSPRNYRLVWSTPAPLKTYGATMLAEIRAVDPDAVIWDTREKGRPDLTKVALDIYRGDGAAAGGGEKVTSDVESGLDSAIDVQSNASIGATSTSPYEAVFVVSNQRVTEEVVYGLEKRGVPAYGPVFDS